MVPVPKQPADKEKKKERGGLASEKWRRGQQRDTDADEDTKLTNHEMP